MQICFCSPKSGIETVEVTRVHTTTKALVLRSVDYKETDRILTLLAQDRGKLTASARGSRKRGSPLAAGSQLLCWSEVVLFDYQGRWTIKEMNIERQFDGVRRDIEKLALACYFAQVTELLAVEGLPCPELLSLTLNSLHALERMNKPLALVKAAYELKALCLAGYEPLLEGCGVCGAEEPKELRFHLREGVLHCAGCKSRLGDGISMPLDQTALEAMRHIVYGDPKRLFSFVAGGKSLKLLADLSEAYLHTQLERGFSTLDFYKQMTITAP